MIKQYLLFDHLRGRSLHLFLLHLFALGTDALQELICKLKVTPRYTSCMLCLYRR